MPDRYGEHDEPLDDDDYVAAARRGMDMIRAVMGWKSYCQRCGAPHADDCKRPENA